MDIFDELSQAQQDIGNALSSMLNVRDTARQAGFEQSTMLIESTITELRHILDSRLDTIATRAAKCMPKVS